MKLSILDIHYTQIGLDALEQVPEVAALAKKLASCSFLGEREFPLSQQELDIMTQGLLLVESTYPRVAQIVSNVSLAVPTPAPKPMNEPVVVVRRVPGRPGAYFDETIEFEGLTFGMQRDLAREQWEIRNEQRCERHEAAEEEFNEDEVIDELRSGLFWA